MGTFLYIMGFLNLGQNISGCSEIVDVYLCYDEEHVSYCLLLAQCFGRIPHFVVVTHGCRSNMVDAFRTHIMQTKDLGTCPVRQIGGCSFLYMRISNVYIVIVVSSNANAACALKFVVEVWASSSQSFVTNV